MKKLLTSLFIIVIIVITIFPGIIYSQLTGTKSIPGDYASISLAITDLNTQGVGSGGVTFNVAAGYTETAANLTITATGTSANQIIFQKSGSGANPLITAAAGTGTLDGIIKLSGADYVSFIAIDLQESSGNTTTTTQMEWGYALLKVDGTNGSQSNTIRNCSITLNKTNTATYGIYSANHTAASSTSLTVTVFSGTNSNNKFYSNQIQNCYSGIYVTGYSSAAPYDLYDHYNQIGAQGGNTIRTFGGAAVSAYGVYTIYQDSLAVSNNDIGGGTGNTTTLYGIMISTSTNSSILVYNNTVSDTTATTTSSTYGIALNNAGVTGTDNTVVVKRNTVQGMTSTAATSAALYGYYIYYTTSINLYIDSNKFINNKWGGSTQTATGAIYGFYIYPYSTAPTSGSSEYITNNYVAGNKRTQSALGTGTHYGMYIYYGNDNVTAYNNIFENDTLTTTSTNYSMYVYNYYASNVSYYDNIVRNIYRPGSGSYYGIYISNAAYTGTFNYYNNTVNNIRAEGATIYGHYLAATSVTKNIYNNKANTLYTTASGSVYGIYTSGGTTVNFYKNSAYDLRTAAGYGYGITLASGTTVNAYNNFITDIRCDSINNALALMGLYISGGTNVNAYYNTIYLNSVSTGTTFGTAALYASTTPIVDLRNNIAVNVSVPGSAGGSTVAYYRSSNTVSTYASISNNNIFYAGTPAANKLIYYDGTISFQDLISYKSYMAPRETNSMTENPPFINVSSRPYDLHISASIPTGVESGGTPIINPIVVNTDYDGQTRNATTPDIGADEGTFILGDLQSPAISYNLLNYTNNTGNRTLVAAITDNITLQNTPPNDPRIYYKKGFNGTFKYRNKTSQAGNDFTFTIVVDSIGGLATGDTVFYYVAAQDVGTPPLLANCGTNPSGGSGINPPGTTAPAVPNIYVIVQPPITGTYTIPGTPYSTIASAINDITLRGVGSGGATFNVAAGYTETAANLLLDNSNLTGLLLAPGNPIVFQKSGSGTNPLITAGTGTGTLDGIIKISGMDNVTFDGIDLTEDYVNNITSVTQMEWGYAVLKPNGSNGAQYITIKNCNITLNKTNLTTVGIYSANHSPASATSLIVNDTSGANSNNKFYSNNISNVNTGIWIAGYSDATPYSFYDQNNEIGTTGTKQNKVSNFGSTTTAYGVYVLYQNGIKIFNTNINNTGGAAATSALYGIYTSTGVNSNVDIYADTVTVVFGGTSGVLGAIYNAMGATGTSNTINIYNNVIQNCAYDAATSSAMYYLYMSAGGYNVNIHNNKIINNTYGSAAATATGTIYYLYTFGGTASSNNWQLYNNTISNNSRTQSALSSGTVYMLYNSASGPSMTVYGNLISDNVLPSTGAIYCMYMTSSYMTLFNCYNNTIRNLTRPNASTGSVYCMYLTGGAASGVANIYNNSINNISSSGAGLMYGLYSSNSNIDKNIYQDTIYNLSTEGSYIYGIYSASGITTKIYQNKIYGLNVGTDTTGYVYGGYITGGTTNHIYNNFISDLKAPASTSVTAVAGLYFTGGTTDNVFYNSIYLNAVSSSVTTFGTAGIYMTASASYTLDMRNNIIVNVSTPGPTGGFTAAYRRSTTTLTSYSSNSNNNDFYAGTPAYNRVIFYDGTNADSVFTAYQTRVAPRDAASFTENPPFVNVSTAPYDLHLSASTPTWCESYGIPVSAPIAITNDYDNQTRNATNPDVGADEGNFMLALPLAPVLVSPPNGALSQPLTPLLDWNDVLTAASYRVQVSKDSLFGTTVLDSSGITASQLNVPAGRLGNDTIYYWKVRAANTTGAGPWCTKWNFRTELGIITFNLTLIPGGFYNSSSAMLYMKDTVRGYLVDSVTCQKVDSAKTVIDSALFTGQFIFTNAQSGNYYLFIYHRNHLPVASSVSMTVQRGAVIPYNFVSDSSKAYGNNMIKVSTSPVRWGLIPSDANQDGFTDAQDQFIWIGLNGLDGYLIADFNGDSFVDAIDQAIWINYNGLSSFLPCGFIDIEKASKWQKDKLKRIMPNYNFNDKGKNK